MTAHGFRILASTLLNEQGWHPDLIELQLAHEERNKVRAAYNRAQRLAERRKMMQAWADYLDGLRAGAQGRGDRKPARVSKRAPPKFRVRIKWRSMVPIAARRLDGYSWAIAASTRSRSSRRPASSICAIC